MGAGSKRFQSRLPRRTGDFAKKRFPGPKKKKKNYAHKPSLFYFFYYRFLLFISFFAFFQKIKVHPQKNKAVNFSFIFVSPFKKQEKRDFVSTQRATANDRLLLNNTFCSTHPLRYKPWAEFS